MNTIFTIILVIAILSMLFILYNTQLLNRKCFFKNKEKIEKYSVRNTNVDLEVLFNKYNTRNHAVNISNINKHYSYSKGSIDRAKYDTVKPIINTIIK